MAFIVCWPLYKLDVKSSLSAAIQDYEVDSKSYQQIQRYVRTYVRKPLQENKAAIV